VVSSWILFFSYTPYNYRQRGLFTQFAFSGREGVLGGGVHNAPTKMPTIITAIILGTLQGQYWDSFKHAVSWENQTALRY
jgi:hypothetical protein